MPKKGQKPVPWTSQEEERLIENVRNHVTNLTKAFSITSKEIQRTPCAIQAHWYARTSRDSKHTLFLTCSGKHVAVNRKNGKGVSCKLSIYKKILAIFGLKY